MEFLSAAKEAASTLDPMPRIFEVQQFFKDSTARGANTDPATFKPFHISDPKNHVFLCLFSSGTTGKKKIVALTDYGILHDVHMSSQFEINGDNGVAFSASQTHWISWWVFVMECLTKGWTRIFLNQQKTCKDVLAAIDKFKPTTMYSQPYVLFDMAKEIDEKSSRWNIASLRAIFVGGDILRKTAHEELTKKLKTPIYQRYGSTEAGTVLQSRVNDPIVYGSAGKPYFAKLVDVDTGKEITTPNTPGEIVVKRTIFREYLNNPEANASAFDKDGWFKMEDLALFDESGNYFVIERMKQIFKCRGLQISPSELEGIIKEIPGVKDAGVARKEAGVEMGYLPTAIVVKAADSAITEKDIIDYVEANVDHDAKRLRGGVIFTNEIPRNANGKIVRDKLKALLNP